MNNMEDIKENVRNVKEVLTKLEDTIENASSQFFPKEEPKTDRDLVRYAIKAM